MKNYTVYLVFSPYREWHEGHLVYVNCLEKDAFNKALESLKETNPDLDDWCVEAYMILEGKIKPIEVFKR